MAEYPFTPSGFLGVPVGAILAYVGPKNDSILGPSWTFCDGRQIDAPGSPVHGMRTPMLEDELILVGTGNGADVAEAHGSNAWDSDGSHSHDGDSGQANIGGFNPPQAFQTRGDHCFNHSHSVHVDGGAHFHGEKLPRRVGVRYIIRIR